MRRKRATALIDSIRSLVSEAGDIGSRDLPTGDYQKHMARLMAQVCAELHTAGLNDLTPCCGEAHSDAFIDNCMRCAPRWGWVGPVEVVS